MANTNKEASAKQDQKQGQQLQVIGTKDKNNGAAVLRFQRDGRKQPMDLVPGQILSVGEDQDLTADEAKRLLSVETWDVKEVKNNG